MKAELADRVTEHTETKIFVQNDTASETARRLAISVSVFEKNGSEVQFWARRKIAKVAKDVHDFVEKFEAVQVEQSDRVVALIIGQRKHSLSSQIGECLYEHGLTKRMFLNLNKSN